MGLEKERLRYGGLDLERERLSYGGLDLGLDFRERQAKIGSDWSRSRGRNL